METKDKIHRMLFEKKLKRKDVINSVGVTKGSVSNWLSGKTKPDAISLIKLCEYLSCDPEWLMNDEAPFESQKPSGVGEARAEYMVQLSAWDDGTPVDDDEVARPCFTEVEAAAGAGKTVVQENHGPKIRFSRRTLSKCGVIEENAYGIKVSGNSMTPVLPHGATIGVDVGNKKIVDGEMYAIDHSGMLRVKLLYREPGLQVRLSSFNREEYKDETVSLIDVKVIGRVFWYSVLR